MPLHPTRYAEMLGERLESQGVRIWLVNTGWSGGGYGVGKRMSLKYTRAMIGAAMRGELDHVPTTKDAIFGLESPQSCPGVPAELLQPSKTWTDQEAYRKAAHNLAGLFTKNFALFENECSPAIMAGAPMANK